RFTDFRIGPERPMARLLRDVGIDGAFRSINHAWVADEDGCGGCGWTDLDAGTIRQADGFEVLNGSTPSRNGDLPGWRLWSDLLNRGVRLGAGGGGGIYRSLSRRQPISRRAAPVVGLGRRG